MTSSPSRFDFNAEFPDELAENIGSMAIALAEALRGCDPLAGRAGFTLAVLSHVAISLVDLLNSGLLAIPDGLNDDDESKAIAALRATKEVVESLGPEPELDNVLGLHRIGRYDRDD